MSNCENCGNLMEGLPFNCRRCSGHFCSHCRLPEIHNCSGLRKGNIFTKLSGTNKKNEHTYQDEGDDSDSLSPDVYRPLTAQHIKMPKIFDSFWTFLTYLLCATFFANILFPFVLLFMHSDMQLVMGNPKPLYFYDISPSCVNYNQNVISSLSYLSSETGVNFINLPHPFALISGGISYDCNGALSNIGAAGEAESGYIGASYFIFVWNNIRLLDMSRTTILHETLHVMGFDHSQNQNSIMNSHAISNVIERDLIEFIRKIYVGNPFVYLNVVPLNVFYEVFFSFLILWWLFSLFKN